MSDFVPTRPLTAPGPAPAPATHAEMLAYAKDIVGVSVSACGAYLSPEQRQEVAHTFAAVLMDFGPQLNVEVKWHSEPKPRVVAMVEGYPFVLTFGRPNNYPKRAAPMKEHRNHFGCVTLFTQLCREKFTAAYDAAGRKAA